MSLSSLEKARMMRRVALAAVIVAAALTFVKAAAFVFTNSMAMLASLMDSALDICASFVNFLAVRHSLVPADAEHRFGHGKAEPLAGIAQSAFIGGSAMVLVVGASERLFEPVPVEHGLAGLWVMVVSIVATVLLVTAQGAVVRRTGSVAIGADRIHYISDLLTNLGVIVGIVLASRFGILAADPLVGIAVAGVLAAGSWRVFRRSLDQLMDREMPEAAREKIKAIVRGHAKVAGLHDLRTREAGVNAFIQIHIELDPGLSLFDAHAVGDEVEDALQAAFPNAEIIIHQDPAGVETVTDLAKT